MRRNSVILAASACIGLIQADQVSSFNPPPEVAESHACDSTCQATLAAANAADLEMFGTSFDFDFYATAGNFSGSKPGDVLKLQPVNSSMISVPQGSSVYKMQYTSEDLDGSPVPVTGFIAFPFAKTSQPFDVVAHAHGTSGVFRGCTPSTAPNFYNYQNWSPLVVTGYAVVGTDYAGLGNNYTAHKYLSNAAHANDVVYSIIAARKVFAQYLSNRWVAIGHSQGGSAIWKLSEHRLVQDPKSGYLGGVALAPAATKLYETAQLGLDKLRNATSARDFKFMGGLSGTAIALKRVFPDYNPSWLSQEMGLRIQLANIGQFCVIAMGSLITGLPFDKIITTFNVTGDTTMKQFQLINAPGQGSPASKPLIVIHGQEDSLVPWEATVAVFKDTCKHGNPARLSLYPGVDHNALVTVAAPEWLRFIAERFSNVPFPHGCSQSVITPFNLPYSESPLD